MMCNICSQQFDNTFDHVFKDVLTDGHGGSFANSKDVEHGNHIRAIETGSSNECFCGGMLKDMECMNCGFNFK